jgi:hypothetical protein
VASAFTHQSTFWGRTAVTNSRESACIVAVSEMESCNEAH